MQVRIAYVFLALLMLVSIASAAGIVIGIDSQTAGAGGKAVIPVKITGASSVGGLDLSVDYDTAALKFVKGDAGPLAQNGMIEVNEVQPGTINIGVVDSQGITGDGNVILLTFDVVGVQGTSSPMTVTVRGAYGTDLKDIGNQATGGTITVGPPGSGGKNPLPLPAAISIIAVSVAVVMVANRWTRHPPEK